MTDGATDLGADPDIEPALLRIAMTSRLNRNQRMAHRQ
jgi:hypothetical protein